MFIRSTRITRKKLQNILKYIKVKSLNYNKSLVYYIDLINFKQIIFYYIVQKLFK